MMMQHNYFNLLNVQLPIVICLQWRLHASRYYKIGVDQKKLTKCYHNDLNSKMNFTRKVIRSRISKDRKYNGQRINNNISTYRPDTKPDISMHNS